VVVASTGSSGNKSLQQHSNIATLYANNTINQNSIHYKTSTNAINYACKKLTLQKRHDNDLPTFEHLGSQSNDQMHHTQQLL